MSFNTTNSARSLYDGGTPQPGMTISNDPGELKVAGVCKEDETIYFGRVIAPYTLDSDNNRIYENISDSTTASPGVSCFSHDAIALASSGAYSEFEAMTVKERGFIVMETKQALTTSSTLRVFNGDGSEPEDIGKLGSTNGSGYSTVTSGLRLVKVLSSTLVEVEITGPIVLSPI